MVGTCFTVRPVFSFGRVVMSYSQMGVEVSYLKRQADMGGGLYQISLQMLHWESISFCAEFFKASMSLHAACFFYVPKNVHREKYFLNCWLDMTIFHTDCKCHAFIFWIGVNSSKLSYCEGAVDSVAMIVRTGCHHQHRQHVIYLLCICVERPSLL